ncbi:hypothetical protein FOQG_05983 [Fusarium oxysporum f. sp. raphani 54005]|uniref:Uncharacterized protein n=8 Tax=Fusarium oxysporum TaxID=5507 RepID=W9IH48_FUSOX|nr:hypothetical protein FOXG_20331 [Fusarium oxysporum f. sp. lycopersici 4287]EWY91831.1 hypothetical protein FOYG_08788 [Fusarium oxysporum NRRL 32931]EWZ38494.1 hypothetical protein FOZG_10083 [Fusarium oxysporum Fo47]EWZ83054.1 hypothetical protein FOWG_13771 [Fusarium oxysporum f. sp. lycopersici MN25]EXA46082.1 hypothetical protein FOVG_06852 [Fusarium oxysporum f. sp. pisi HDV247]EXK40586.1 hypothetical protein FOMG_07376 [Fusarium oxysporum f. sp. melonis 26406]EXK92007.1 hypothetical
MSPWHNQIESIAAMSFRSGEMAHPTQPPDEPCRLVNTAVDSQQQLLRRGGRVGEQNTKQPGL